MPIPRTLKLWRETWQSGEARLDELRVRIREAGGVVLIGGDFDAWDLEARGGLLGSARSLMTVEEHGDGRQLIRLRIWPRFSIAAVIVALGFGALAIWAAFDRSFVVAAILGASSVFLVLRTLIDAGTGTSSLARSFGDQFGDQ